MLSGSRKKESLLLLLTAISRTWIPADREQRQEAREKRSGKRAANLEEEVRLLLHEEVVVGIPSLAHQEVDGSHDRQEVLAIHAAVLVGVVEAKGPGDLVADGSMTQTRQPDQEFLERDLPVLLGIHGSKDVLSEGSGIW